ncbi:hypothetical protein OROGR_004142 [Orobanche gracilis]
MLMLKTNVSAREERPEDWVPEETHNLGHETHEQVECSETIHVNEDNRDTVDIFSIHSEYPTDSMYVRVPQRDDVAEVSHKAKEMMLEDTDLLRIWGQQFVDALRGGDYGSAYLEYGNGKGAL